MKNLPGSFFGQCSLFVLIYNVLDKTSVVPPPSAVAVSQSKKFRPPLKTASKSNKYIPKPIPHQLGNLKTYSEYFMSFIHVTNSDIHGCNRFSFAQKIVQIYCSAILSAIEFACLIGFFFVYYSKLRSYLSLVSQAMN